MRISHIDDLLKQGFDKSKIKFIVTHDYYGCDTGCCGHRVEYFIDGVHKGGNFSFDHPSGWDFRLQKAIQESPREFAERMIREECGEEHVSSLNWEECIICED